MDKNRHRVARQGSATLRNWDAPNRPGGKTLPRNASIDCGWGRLIFAHTFDDDGALANAICDEEPQKRNIGLYIKDPHVLLSVRPQELFLDPSHTYRLWLYSYQGSRSVPRAFHIRRAQDARDARAISRLLSSRNMVPTDPAFIEEQVPSRMLTHFVAEDIATKQVIGTVMGVDHKRAFGDVENGSSLWALAVDAQSGLPGIGTALVGHLADHFLARGREFMDLSVMHDNSAVIRLYEKMGFQRIPVFSVKSKNAINEPLYTGREETEKDLNPYARIIVDEARRRGIAVNVIDAPNGYFSLSVGAKSIVCRESLTELTTAIALARCDDKQISIGLLRKAGLQTPGSRIAGNEEENLAFLQQYGRIVVKPVSGEQGKGVHVGIANEDDMRNAITDAGRFCDRVMLEEYVEGEDLRIVVIDGEVVAAALRKPAEITGNGRDSVELLIRKQSRRRAAATGGESEILIDGEVERRLAAERLTLDAVPAEGRVIRVRETANLHTGGTLHDVTEDLHPDLAAAAEKASRTLNIPVVGLDLIVEAPDRPQYRLIEANERPGLANHEPQPTAERFVDFLFPQTAQK